MNVLLWVLGLGSTVAAIWFFRQYSVQPSENHGFGNMILAIVFVVVACICAFIFFYKKTRDEADQDISITKF